MASEVEETEFEVSKSIWRPALAASCVVHPALFTSLATCFASFRTPLPLHPPFTRGSGFSSLLLRLLKELGHPLRFTIIHRQVIQRLPSFSLHSPSDLI